VTSELDTLEKGLADLEDGGKDGGPPKRKLGTAPLVVAILAVSALGGLVYYAYDQGIREGTEVAAPLLAPEGPAKVKPEDPGGLAVPHRDKTVYDVVQGGASDTAQEKVETLLPPPEEPMVPPATAPAAAPAAAPVVTATNKLNEAEKPAVPQISPPPLPAEELAAPEAPATLSEMAEEKIEAAQEKVAETVAAITPPPAEPKPEPAAVTAPAEPQPAAEAPAETAPVQTAAKTDTATQGTDPAISQKWRIQVGAVRTQEAAVQEWARILRTNKELVGGLTLQVQEVDVTGKGTFFRIRGGPMADKDAADALCGKLKAKNIPCIPVRPGA